MSSLWQKSGILLTLPGSPGTLMYDDDCCCEEGDYHEFLRCETNEFKYILNPTLNLAPLDLPTPGNVYKFTGYECWEYIRKIACPPGGDCVDTLDFTDEFISCELCNPVRCVLLVRCGTGEQRLVSWTADYIVGRYGTDSESNCWYVAEDYPYCPGETVGTPIVAWLDQQDNCNQCVCGCYESLDDPPATITATLTGMDSGCNGENPPNPCDSFNIPYVLTRVGNSCLYRYLSGGMTVEVTLGRPQEHGNIGAAQVATGKVESANFVHVCDGGGSYQSSFMTCNYEGTTACGGQAMPVLPVGGSPTIAEDQCCPGSTLTFTV